MAMTLPTLTQSGQRLVSILRRAREQESLLDWLVLLVLGGGLGLPLLGGWLYLTRQRDLTPQGWDQRASLEVPTMVDGTDQGHEGAQNMSGD